ncbi:MAG: hypothetical protein IJX47_00905 [Clostridia bacterium]|nr:hypothetical protein [Clostridia bacterium]
MESVFLTVLNMSLTASWIILALFLLRLLLRRAPRWLLCLLWIPAAVRLTIPFTVESILCLLPSGEPVPQEILVTAKPQIHTGIEMLNSAVNPILESELSPAPGASVNPMQVIAFVAAIVWIAGILALLTYAAVGYLRLARRVRVSAPLEGLDETAKPAHIRICDNIGMPFILGIFRPRIYLPSAMDAATMEQVIAHERAHLSRRDHLWKPLGYLILALHWFNPLVWVAYILFCRDLETACDEKVIRKMNGEEKAAYSETLLTCSHPKRAISACPLAFGEIGVKGRIKSILHYKKPTVWVIGAVVIAAAVLVVFFMTSPKKEVSQESHNLPSRAIMEVARTLPGCVAIDEYGFYAYDLNGTLYRISWENTAEIEEGETVLILYREIREKDYPDGYPDGGFNPSYTIKAIHVQSEDTFAFMGESGYDSIDRISYDFDRDGYDDNCMLGFGGTSGVFSFTFTVERDGILKYHEFFGYSSYFIRGFYLNDSGKLQVYGEKEDGTTYYFDIIVDESGDILLCTDEAEIIPY